ncbi:hypothetical protein RR46_04158 [Papilio xuthus]|uniref:Uncharacterized protein n=1 Tax=Papilio xuthus TaxID=66420 RepID=A0A194QHQ7_PAPXU|nr:hypothetical protein RR46_04158 [Papilio xuthus]
MDNTAHNIQISTKAKPIRELLPELKGIISKDSMRTLMAAQPTPRRVDLKPLSFTEMRSVLMELKDDTTVKCTPAVNQNRKSRWNYSVKVPKTEPKHVTSKESSARKTPKLQPKPMTFTNPVTPKASKPVWNGKKSIVPDKIGVRISGVYRIPETPTNKSNSVYKNRKTLFNKENDVRKVNMESNFRKPLQTIPDAPLSNISSTSSCDTSFLQTEKKIQDLISKTEAKPFKEAGPTLEDIEEVSPILSTPPKECTRHEDFLFNNNDTEIIPPVNSIICFDVVNQSNLNCMQLNDLLKLREQNEGKIKIMEQYLKTMTEQQKYIDKIIKEKKIDSDINRKFENKEYLCENKLDNSESVTKSNASAIPCSVIKSPSKSPTYKIPRKNLCLRKKVFHKSMPNISNGTQSPNKDNDNKALSIYMKMKEQMIFLNTPIKSKNVEAPNTPAVTSQNLQMQLDKLYNCS